MLHTLEGIFEIPDLKLGKIHPRLLYLEQLRIRLMSITLIEMTTLLLSFPKLAYLSINAFDVNSDMVNGFTLSRLLQQIKYFEFKFEFSDHAFGQQRFNLDSFRTKFWLEEKKWFVTYEQNLNDYPSSMLYSNSSSLIVYPPYEMSSKFVSESTASEPTSFPHIHCLTINDNYLKYLLLRRYTHVNEIHLYEMTNTSATTFTDLAACIDISQIVTCNIDSYWNRNSLYEYIEILRSLPRLRRLKISLFNLRCFFLHQWPHIVQLEIKYDFESRLLLLNLNDIDALCHSFPYLEQLEIDSLLVVSLARLLNRMKMMLTNIIIRQPSNTSNDKLITRQWIERNTELKNFCYTCSPSNCVKLWL
jgi:hypothetical protein